MAALAFAAAHAYVLRSIQEWVPLYNRQVSYEQGFEALKNGDFHAAVPLLEKAARDTAYTSDIINHAYTLALYRTGDKERLADVAFTIGNSLVRDDPASAMDYFQRALFAGLNAARVRRIGEAFEGWSASRDGTKLEGSVGRVAHVTGSLSANQSMTKYLKMLVSSLKDQGVESTIFTTETSASWFFNPSGVMQSEPVDMEAEVRVASVEGDFVERAGRIVQALGDSGIQVAFFHGNLSEQITARVAALRPAPVQINVNHDNEMDADLFDGFVHFFKNAMERTRFPALPAEVIRPASDIQTRIAMTEPLTKQAIGLESASTISATFGNLSKVSGRGYIRMLIEILKRFPKHFHLFAGSGSVKALRGALHSEGVLPRVRFLGHVGDIAPLLTAVDVYLATFPDPDGSAVLEAMGAGKPMVVLRDAPDSLYNSGAELVGLPDLIASTEFEYIEIAERLLGNSALRQKQGQALSTHFRKEYRPERLGERYVKFIDRLINVP